MAPGCYGSTVFGASSSARISPQRRPRLSWELESQLTSEKRGGLCLHASLGKVKPTQGFEIKVNKKEKNNNPEPPAPSKQVWHTEGALQEEER